MAVNQLDVAHYGTPHLRYQIDAGRWQSDEIRGARIRRGYRKQTRYL